MANKKQLNALPQVVIGFPLDPTKLSKGSVILPVQSPWRNAEREFVLGILTTAAFRAGDWIPVDMPTFGKLLKEGPWTIFAQGVINAVWSLAEEGFVDIVTVNGEDYILPLPTVAGILQQSRIYTS